MSRPDRIPGFGLYVVLGVLVLALRQDPWFADDRRLLFGALPADLAWQAGLSLLAVAVMALLVRRDWPAHLEALDATEADDEARVDRG